MNKQKELVKSTAIIIFGKMCTQLVSFFLLPLYTAILSTSEYGTVDLIISYSMLALPFVTLAMEQGLFRYLIDVRNNFQKVSEYITTTIFTVAVIFSVLTIVLIICFLYFNNKLILYFGLLLFANTVSTISLQICRGLGDSIGYALGSSLTAIVQVALNIFFLVVLKMDIYGMMLASVLGNLVCGVITFHRCDFLDYIHIKKLSRNVFREIISYSLPLIPNQISWWALNASDKVIVQFFIGVTGNGLLAVANKFSGVYIQFSGIFNISWTESATLHINDEDAESFFTETINAVYTLFLSICCGMIVVMPFVFPYLINSKYSKAYGLIPIFMLASLFNVVVSLYGVIYVAHKKTVEIARTAVYAALLNAASHLLMIKFIGIYASAISTAIGYGAMAFYRYFHSRKYLCVKIYSKTIVVGFIMIVISSLSYFSLNLIFQIGSFLFVLMCSVFLNKKILVTIIKIGLKKRK